MRTLTDKQIEYIEKALTHHINYKTDFGGTPRSLAGVPKVPYSPNSSSDYLRVMDCISMGNKGSMSEKLSATLNEYFSIVGVKNLREALKRLADREKSLNMNLYKGCEILVDYKAQYNQDVIDYFEEASNFEGYAELDQIDYEAGIFTIKDLPMNWISLEYLVVMNNNSGGKYYVDLINEEN